MDKSRGNSKKILIEKKGERGNQKIIARTRCGNTEEWNKYWDKEETRKCMLCERGSTLKHWLEDCEKIEKGEMHQKG